MNELTPGKVVGDGKAEAALHKSATDLDNAGYQLLLEELQFDERCLEVYKGKLSNFEVRVAQLRDSWRQKRNQHAKDAILKWMDFNVSQLVQCMLDFLFCWYLLVIWFVRFTSSSVSFGNVPSHFEVCEFDIHSST